MTPKSKVNNWLTSRSESASPTTRDIKGSYNKSFKVFDSFNFFLKKI